MSRIHFRAMESAAADAPSGMRRVQPLPEIVEDTTTPRGYPPQMGEARPQDLLVDERYQRDLSRTSLRLVKRIIANWDWAKFKPPICVEVDGALHIIDGQHTAIAAASHPEIETIPILIIMAEGVEDRAGAFVSHNRDRTAISGRDLYAAGVAAKFDSEAAIERAAESAGVKIMRRLSSPLIWKAGETIAIQSSRRILKRRGEEALAACYRVCAKARLAPIGADDLLAVECALFWPGFRGRIAESDLAEALGRNYAELLSAAKRRQAEAGGQFQTAFGGILIDAMRRAGKIDPGAESDIAQAAPPAPERAPAPASPPPMQKKPDPAKSGQSKPILTARPKPADRNPGIFGRARTTPLSRAERIARDAAAIEAALRTGKVEIQKCPPAYVGEVEGGDRISPGLTERAEAMHAAAYPPLKRGEKGEKK